jgi:hypothetical protein
MVRTIIIGALFAAAVSAEIDIPAFLASLGPAPANDPRFTNWVAPGKDDVRSPCPGLVSYIPSSCTKCKVD